MTAPRHRGPRRLVAATILLVGLLFVFAFPGSALLDQHRQLDDAQQRLAVLRAQTHKLEAESERLQSDAAIERIARDRYGMVRPGEQAFAVVPPSPSSTTTTTAAPSATTSTTTARR